MSDQAQAVKIPVPARDVASRLVRGTAILLHAQRDELETFNEVGTFIWSKLLERRHELADMCSAITEEFDVDEATASADLEGFISWLDSRGFIVFEERTTG
jgi:hypothetical protein